jgi:hypothetical protein
MQRTKLEEKTAQGPLVPSVVGARWNVRIRPSPRLSAPAGAEVSKLQRGRAFREANARAVRPGAGSAASGLITSCIASVPADQDQIVKPVAFRRQLRRRQRALVRAVDAAAYLGA